MGIYQEFGITPIINASGAVTRLGGAPMNPETLAAFAEAARASVPLEQLQASASRIIAEATATEAGLITSGAASALTLGAAAILTGYNLKRMETLPHCQDFPNQFVIARQQRNGYDHAIRASGAHLVEVGFNELAANAGVRQAETWEYGATFNTNTAGVVYVYSSKSTPDLRQVVDIAHEHHLPVLVDAAAELPPKSNLKSIAATGADLVAFSGGKAIRGPQSTGILCGKRDLIGSAALQMLDMDDHLEFWDPPADFIDRTKFEGIPRHGIGRGFKVSKEEIIALLVALRLFISGAYDASVLTARSILEEIAQRLQDCPVQCAIYDKEDKESLPVLEITVKETISGPTAMTICRDLRSENPPIYLGHARVKEGKLLVNPLHLDKKAAEIISERIHRSFS
ncbi:MAG: aminotransferase class V-fold PLP-dependent enzyme [Candidatus Poribacteria bacterium]|nr:aminotransferase class V-fold PLP-dependent enzyme [Candidatus Poribacteria bacterium]